MSDDALLSRLDKLEQKVDQLLAALSNGAPVNGAAPLNGATTAWTQAMATRLAEIERVEGTERAEQFGEALVEISDPEVMGALARMAQLAPQIEYLVQIVAAGPVLLEETLDSIRDEVGPHDDKLRMQAGIDLARTAVERDTLQAATTLASHVPHLTPAIDAAGQAVREVHETHGEGLTDELREAVRKLADPEVISSLGRIAELAPSLEYAAYIAAAGPELLEDTLHWARTSGGQGAIDRLQHIIGQPGFLDETTDVIELVLNNREQLVHLIRLLEVLPDESTMRSLLETLPKLAQMADAVDFNVLNDVIDVAGDADAIALVRALTVAAKEARNASPNPVNFWGLFTALSNPDVQRTVGFGIDVSKAFAKQLKQLPAVTSK